MRFPELEPELRELESSVGTLRDAFVSLWGNGKFDLHMHDLLVWQVALRTRALTRAFCDLVREDNDYVAPALIRVNLEHLLLLKAGELHVGGPDGLVNELMSGKRLEHIKDRCGERMTGAYLSRRCDAEGSLQIEKIWGFYSGFVHFDPLWLTPGFVSARKSDGGTIGTVTYEFPKDSYSIRQVGADDVATWIQIMQFVVFNVQTVLSGCVQHAMNPGSPP